MSSADHSKVSDAKVQCEIAKLALDRAKAAVNQAEHVYQLKYHAYQRALDENRPAETREDLLKVWPDGNFPHGY